MSILNYEDTFRELFKGILESEKATKSFEEFYRNLSSIERRKIDRVVRHKNKLSVPTILELNKLLRENIDFGPQFIDRIKFMVIPVKYNFIIDRNIAFTYRTLYIRDKIVVVYKEHGDELRFLYPILITKKVLSSRDFSQKGPYRYYNGKDEYLFTLLNGIIMKEAESPNGEVSDKYNIIGLVGYNLSGRLTIIVKKNHRQYFNRFVTSKTRTINVIIDHGTMIENYLSDLNMIRKKEDYETVEEKIDYITETLKTLVNGF